MADVYTVTFIIIGILLSVPALLVAFNLLMPQMTQRAYTRLDAQPNVSRLFDSGNIVIYDVGVFANGISQ